MKTFLNILLFILLFIWQILQNLVALIMLPFIGKLTKVCYRNYCYCFSGSDMMGGISLGNFAFVSERLAQKELDVSHEVDGHTVQSKILGPLYLFVIGIPSLMWAWLRDRKKHPNYYSFYTEKWANDCAGLIAVENEYGYYELRRK